MQVLIQIESQSIQAAWIYLFVKLPNGSALKYFI